jgi:uncharacterized membrane protein YbhN (UPF0104 family)
MSRQQVEAPNGPARVKSLLILLAKIVISGGLLYWLFSRVDFARLWEYARRASPGWLLGALALYTVALLIGTWRWALLLRAQSVSVPGKTLLSSYLVATFFNNFLPSNIGGDVVRIRDTAPATGSKTLATTVVLIDRGVGLMGLVLVAAVGASAGAGMAGAGALPVWPSLLWAGLLLSVALSAPAVLAPAGVGRLLQPLRVFHQEWVTTRIEQVTDALGRLRQNPEALVGCFGGAVLVQAVLVLFYVAIANSMGIPISPWHLAVIVPISFIVQMLPVSVNGFGVREATFTFYFTRLGLPHPLESALMVSFLGAALIMLFSLSGAFVYVGRTLNRHIGTTHETVA